MATNSLLQAYRDEANRLQAEYAKKGEKLTHCAALEMVARRHGHYDWRTLRAHVLRGAVTGAALAPRPRKVSGDNATGSENATSLSEAEIAQYLTEEDARELLTWHNERYPEQVVELSCCGTDPKRVLAAVVELQRRTKADLPPFRESETVAFLQHVNGLSFEGMSYTELPEMIAQGLADDSFADWTARRFDTVPSAGEHEEALNDPVARSQFGDTEQNRAVQKYAQLNPTQVLALVVAARFWWASREGQMQRNATGDFINEFTRFFDVVPEDRPAK